MPVWFITGCSTGLGRCLAQAVLERGCNAVVTARNPAAVQDIVAHYPMTALALTVDVTDRTQISEAVRKAEDKFGRIDVLVNNAGYGYRAAVEEADEKDVADLFATNFFGLVAMTKAVLPGMRTRRHGTILNISSTAGRMANPGSGYYSASKFAVAGMSDALRKEVGPLGIRVILVEPGAFRTDHVRSLKQSAMMIDDYAATAGQRRKENDQSDGRQPGDPVRAAQAMIRAAEAAHPPTHLALGRVAYERIGAELDAQRKELEAWAEVSVSADFPAKS